MRYDPSKGRNRQTVITKLSEWGDALPTWAATGLTAGERANAEAFFAARRQERRRAIVPEAVTALIM